MKKTVKTIKDLAELLEISPSTVSRVFSSDPKISRHTRKLVLETAKKYNFRPNRHKRPIVNHEIRVLLTTPSIYSEIPHLMDEIMELLDGISTAFIGTKKNLEIVTYDELVKSMQSKLRIVDGVIFIFQEIDNNLKKILYNAGIPYIHLNRSIKPYSSTNEVRNMAFLLKHLKERDYRKPVYLNYTVHPRSEDRELGFYAACNMYYPEIRPEKYNVDNLDEITPDIIRKIIEKGHDALVCFNDYAALTAYKAIYKAGFRIPEDIAVTGHDNIPAAEFSIPRLTTIKLPAYTISYLAGKWIMEKIRDKDTVGFCMDLAGDLIIGEST